MSIEVISVQIELLFELSMVYICIVYVVIYFVPMMLQCLIVIILMLLSATYYFLKIVFCLLMICQSCLYLVYD